MKTTLYLVGHGAADTSSAGKRNLNPSLTPLGFRQVKKTRDFLAVRPLEQCFCSPALRTLQTASILGAPHGLEPQTLDYLNDILFGESLLDFQQRIRFAFEQILEPHRHGNESFHCRAGSASLVVAPRRVQSTFLAGLLGWKLDRIDHVRLDPCGITIVTREEGRTLLRTLNASFHLHGIAA